MIVFWRGSYITYQRTQIPKFMVTCKTRDSYMCLVCSEAANSILHSSTHWWKNGGPRHNFHLPYGECTITLEYVALQLGLPVDGPVVMVPAVVPSKEDLCEAFWKGCRISFTAVG
ncbi:hypothetical protein Gotri_022976 [Gossypium trilobum]|uniref:Aminotransferase-like plant mobile domain-containing protein n=1 Tax=Gossypium trilobum TaxID=34281 RepID=A0A7J9DHL1_9ROSI|nr:hypothetical protein [Gossypium trilobum]